MAYTGDTIPFKDGGEWTRSAVQSAARDGFERFGAVVLLRPRSFERARS